MSKIRPSFDRNGVPWCPRSSACPEYDGKRCEITGLRPLDMCEPWVILAAALVKKCLDDRWDALDEALEPLREVACSS